MTTGSEKVDSDGRTERVSDERSPAPPRVEIAPGTRIGGYRVERLLGYGGMGVVYRAIQESLGRPVALKVLPHRPKDDAEFAERFQREAQLLATLSHPRIVSIIDRGLETGIAYFVMELVEGESLRTWIERGKTLPAQTVPLAMQVCEGLVYAHGKGVVHRDIKPENLLVDLSGNVKIADFGLARIVRGSREDIRRITLSGLTLGTPFYMAPEQVQGMDVDERADLYAFGVVLYELLTGALPVGRFHAPARRVPGLDPRLDRLVVKLLAGDAADRPRSARDVLATLTQVWKRLPGASLEVIPEVKPIADPDDDVPEIQPIE